MKHNKIEVEFSIHNNEVFDPGEITRRLKLTPKKILQSEGFGTGNNTIRNIEM